MVSKSDLKCDQKDENVGSLLQKQLKGRKATVFKKASELSTLCNVDVLLVYYDPNSPKSPVAWCSKPDPGAVINEYLRKTNAAENKDVKLGAGGKDDTLVVGDMGLEELNKLSGVLAGKIEQVQQRIDFVKAGNSDHHQSGNNYDGGENINGLNFDDGFRLEDMDFDDRFSLDDLGFDEGFCLDDLGLDSSGDYNKNVVKNSDEKSRGFESYETEQYSVDDDVGAGFAWIDQFLGTHDDDNQSLDWVVDDRAFATQLPCC